MKCPRCRFIEMRVEEIVDNKIMYKCNRCGAVKTEEIPNEEKNIEEVIENNEEVTEE